MSQGASSQRHPCFFLDQGDSSTAGRLCSLEDAVIPLLPHHVLPVCKQALDDQVVHGLRCLVAQWADSLVRQPSPGQAVDSPAAVKVGEPVEEFDPRRRPTLPDHPPRW